MGCGAAGGSSSSNNIGPLDLIDVKRVAWGVRELSELGGGQRAEVQIDREMLDRLVEQIMHRLT